MMRRRNPIQRNSRIDPSPTMRAIDALAKTLRRECPLATLFEAVRQCDKPKENEMPEPTLTISLQLFKDLIDMARKSDQYREGYAWSACAMAQASQLLSRALAKPRVEIETAEKN